MVFYGKIGFGIVNGTLTTAGDSRNETVVLQKFSETTKQQNYALHYGAGMEFFVTESFFLRAEYNEFNFSGTELIKFENLLSISNFVYIKVFKFIFLIDSCNVKIVFVFNGIMYILV